MNNDTTTIDLSTLTPDELWERSLDYGITVEERVRALDEYSQRAAAYYRALRVQ